ncbi:MAG: hypothetical protein ACREB5_12715 [Sphingomonadaceae bacterium]
MQNRRKILALLAGVAVAMAAAAHQETELYIPIGESPGISHLKSWIGPIQSLDATRSGFAMRVGESPKYLAFDKSTKIYLQYTAPGRINRTGIVADCQAGRTAEVYVDDNGILRWVKIRMP